MSERDNIFVSSRGILKSCHYHSSTPHSSIRKLLNYPHLDVIDEVSTPTIYVCSSAIPHFMSVLLPQIHKAFILLSGDCDEMVPDELFNAETLRQLLCNRYLKHWFCQNMTIKHAKITQIPIGLDYHTLETRPLWGPITSCQDQEKILRLIQDKALPFWERKHLCYANYHFSMNTKLGYDRKDAYRNIDPMLVFYESTKVNRTITWKTQTNYAFVICPHGGGLDCHRNWEALCLGCIPIVKTSKIDSLYEGLPVLIVDEWKTLNIDLLDKTIERFKKKFLNHEFNMEKLTLKYWINQINDHR